MTVLDLVVVDGLRQRVADLEARLAATEDALTESNRKIVSELWPRYRDAEARVRELEAIIASIEALTDDGEDDAPPVDSVETA